MIYLNFREYIVDLMAAPGTLIPSDAAGSHIEYDDSSFVASPSSRDLDSSHITSFSSGVGSSSEETSEFGTFEKGNRYKRFADAGKESDVSSRPPTSKEELKKPLNEFKNIPNVEKIKARESVSRPNNYPYTHGRSPSWTEGISSPEAHRMKVKDVSQYMIDVTKENPKLAQKLHDVLLESGVVAPPNLFSEIYHEQLGSQNEANSPTEEDEYKHGSAHKEAKEDNDNLAPRFLPPLPPHKIHPKASPSNQLEHSKPVEGLGIGLSLDSREAAVQHTNSEAEATQVKYGKNVPVAAAAAAAAAVVASSMVVAVAKSSTDSSFEIPVAAAATATAAAVVATTAAVSKQYEQGNRSDGDTEGSGNEPKGSGDGENNALGANSEGGEKSDRSVSNDSTKSDSALDDVAEYDIPWEEITMGERIGLGMNIAFLYKSYTLYVRWRYPV